MYYLKNDQILKILQLTILRMDLWHVCKMVTILLQFSKKRKKKTVSKYIKYIFNMV